jgi:O-antigen/teichoic acid export membrane protein
MTDRTTTRHGLLVVFGRIGFVALWFGAVLLVYRGLGQDESGLAQAGLFAVAIAIVKLASACIVDPGDVALMRRAPDLLRSDPPAAHRLFRAAFSLRLGATFVAGAVLLLLAGLLGRIAVPGVSIAPLMVWVVAAILADMLFRSVMVVLQAQERFPALVLLEGALQVARLAAILMLWAGGWITVEAVLAAYAGVAFLTALAGTAMLMPRGLFVSLAIRRYDVVELLGALKWLVPGMLVGVLNDRLDVLLVYSFGGAGDAGRYGAMVTLALIPDLVAGSLAAILQPRIARMRQEGTYGESLRLFLRFSMPGALLAYLAALALAAPVIGLLLGPGYAPGVPVFLWLLAGTLFWAAVTPLPLAMVAVHAPKRIALVALFQTGLIVGAGLPLFWLTGEVGMAQGVFIMRVGVALALFAMARRLAPMPAAPLIGQEGACASPAR